jgi:SAM-dependent methyltransferase
MGHPRPLTRATPDDVRRAGRNPLGGLVDHNLTYGRHVVRKFLSDAAPYRTLVDIGAGTGQDLKVARDVQPDATLVALEAHPAFVADLPRIADAVHAIDVERDRFPFDDGAIDVVVANQVLEHTKELFWISHEVTRTLRIGGTFIVGVPNLAALHNRVMLALGRQPTCIKSASAHVRGFTSRDLLQFVDACFPSGYRCVARRGSQFYPFRGPMALAAARVAPQLAGSIFIALRKQQRYTDGFLTFPTSQGLETNFFTGP